MSQANASFAKNTPKTESNVNDSGQLKEFRTPPHNLAIEQAVLAALMTVAESFEQVGDLLKENDFYATRHKYIYRAIEKLAQENSPYDAVLVNDWLLKQNLLDAIGGEEYLMQLMADSPSSFYNLEIYASKIKEFSTLRSMIKVSTDILQNAYDTKGRPVSEILDLAETNIFSLAEQHNNNKKDSGPKSISSVTADVISKLDELSKMDGNITGLSTGFLELDNKTYGMQAGDLIIVAARPGMGKTAFTLSMARNMAIDYGAPVAFFSLEMSSVQLITRLISSETGLSSEKLRTGKLEKHEWEQLSIKVKDLEKAPLFIDDTPSLSIFDLRAKARRLSSQYGIKMIVIDYLQLMTAGGNGKGGGNREQEISTISRNLKALAKELNVPVIAISQLSRAVETRGSSKRPLLSDLRESGAIEQDADIVSFIYRPEYYKIDEWDDEERSPTQGQAEFIVAKHRNGGLDNIRLKFIGNLGKFDNLDDFSSPFDALPSKMNLDDSNPFITPNLPTPNEAFGSTMNSFDDDSDVPF